MEALFDSPLSLAGVSLSLVIPLVVLLLRCLTIPQVSSTRTKQIIGRALSTPVAHRADTPENTLAGIRKAHSKGATVVEVDLTFTKDGHPVLLHDLTVDRTSDGKGRIDGMTLEEAKKLDFGSKFGSPGERIPTLYEAIELCDQLDMAILLDVKSDTMRTLAVLRQLMAKNKSYYDRIVVASFYPSLVYLVHFMDPLIMVALIMKKNDRSYASNGSRRHSQWWMHVAACLYDLLLHMLVHTCFWKMSGLSVIFMYCRDISLEVQKYWLKRNVHLLAWTVNSKEEADKLVAMGIPVLTDDITMMKSMVTDR